jgi:hypothetical protein
VALGVFILHGLIVAALMHRRAAELADAVLIAPAWILAEPSMPADMPSADSASVPGLPDASAAERISDEPFTSERISSALQSNASSRAATTPTDREPPWASRSLEDIGRTTNWSAEGAGASRRLAARIANPPKNPFAHEYPDPPPRKPKSVFNDPPGRTGQTIRNADGELVYWVSPNCYISLGSDSIASHDIHAARKGIKICTIPLGKRKARGDLFEDMRK